jgi:hypothetical protein
MLSAPLVENPLGDFLLGEIHEVFEIELRVSRCFEVLPRISETISGDREMAFRTVFFPRSIRFAISTSPSSGEQRDGTHLAQVHPDRVVGLLEVFGSRSRNPLPLLQGCGLSLGLLLDDVELVFGVDQLDAGIAEQIKDAVEIFRGMNVVGRRSLTSS